ncbi:MAG: hypothetical protein U5R30_21290 [Deltaproteobacteria bacterium]|nr:hypothetical protein [Deltaproteobacteria bacterium]
MTVTLLDVTREDLPLIERRLRAEHMRRYRDKPEENGRLLRGPPASCELVWFEGALYNLGIEGPPRDLSQPPAPRWSFRPHRRRLEEGEPSPWRAAQLASNYGTS